MQACLRRDQISVSEESFIKGGGIAVTLLQLLYFQELANRLHYTKAAEALHISQPSLSYAIAELEKELDVKLLQKDKKTVALTVYGQQFLPYADRILSLVDESKSVMNRMSQQSEQVVRLGYFHSISASLIPFLVDGFYKEEENRKIRFQFVETTSYDALNKLKEGEIDLAFCMHKADWAQSVEIMRQPLYLAVPCDHALASHSSVSFQDFFNEPQIVLEQSCALRAQVDQLFSEKGYIPHIVFEVRECNAALQYVALRFGVAILPLVPAMETEKIVVLPFSDHDEQFTRSVYLTYNKKRVLSPAAAKVLDYMQETLKSMYEKEKSR